MNASHWVTPPFQGFETVGGLYRCCEWVPSGRGKMESWSPFVASVTIFGTLSSPITCTAVFTPANQLFILKLIIMPKRSAVGMCTVFGYKLATLSFYHVSRAYLKCRSKVYQWQRVYILGMSFIWFIQKITQYQLVILGKGRLPHLDLME